VKGTEREEKRIRDEKKGPSQQAKEEQRQKEELKEEQTEEKGPSQQAKRNREEEERLLQQVKEEQTFIATCNHSYLFQLIITNRLYLHRGPHLHSSLITPTH
jgi:hypothetical protein